ncbi:MAG: MBOAT family protein [Clostridia bacterium]|nr:MBOAT family protein [Clostridia bacterium]
MVFSGLLFLCLFLPITLLLYNLSRNITYKNIILLAASLVFYGWGEPLLILVMLASALTAFICSHIIDKNRGRAAAKAALAAAAVICIGFLAVFKYAGFFVSNINLLFGTSIGFTGFSLPLGISFYTFQILSYTVDVYRGDAEAQPHFYKFLLYVTMFPQLVAGPIVRYVDIESRINCRRTDWADFEQGVIRFSQGLLKKVILANSAGSIVDSLIGGNLNSLSAAGAWLGILMFTLQIYFDFSGYSDMAIGLGYFFGFRFKENFDYPYTSKSITEFWRRWHISLGSFFRDYVYIPLGGNRRHQLFNIAVVWFLTGFWHGASWNFVLWGVYYGVWLILEKKLIFRFIDRIPTVLRLLYTNAVVVVGWILFYFTDMSRLKSFLIVALGRNLNGTSLLALDSLKSNVWIIVVMVLACTPIFKKLFILLRDKCPKIYSAVLPISVIVVMLICFTMLVKQSYNPFLYFRF